MLSINNAANSLGLGFEKVSQTLHTKPFTLNNTYRFFIIFFFVLILKTEK